MKLGTFMDAFMMQLPTLNSVSSSATPRKVSFPGLICLSITTWWNYCDNLYTVTEDEICLKTQICFGECYGYRIIQRRRVFKSLNTLNKDSFSFGLYKRIDVFL